MIEIIREEDLERTERKELPKDIKQIGKPDIGERIYVENQVYETLHPYDSISEKSAYILLGRFENYAGRQCTFVEAAIRLEEIAFDGELPVWNDQTWAYIYRQLKHEHDSMAIVGWAMDMRGMLPNLTVRMEALHQNNFGGAHQILFLTDSLEHEETFYGSRNGHLYRREGFYIYYDKNAPVRMNRASESVKSEPEIECEENSEEVWKEDFSQEKTEIPQGSYRKQMFERDEKQQMPAYASSLLLLVVVCAFGITAYANYRKMNAMQDTLAQMNAAQQKETQMQAAEPESENEGIKVENVAGNVEKEEQVAEPENPAAESTAMGTNLAGTLPEQNAPTAEAPTDEALPTGAVTAGGTSIEGSTAPTAGTTATAAGTTTEGSAATVGTTPVEESAPELTEAQTYLAQGYYIVQKGDSLVGICKKIYQTTAIMDKLCEINEIEDENEIYAGQRLTLPN